MRRQSKRMMASTTTAFQTSPSLAHQNASLPRPQQSILPNGQDHSSDPCRDSWHSRPSSPEHLSRRAIANGGHPMPTDRAGSTSRPMTPKRIYPTAHHTSSSLPSAPPVASHPPPPHQDPTNLKLQTSHTLYPYSAQSTPTTEAPPSPRSRSAYQPIRPLSTPLPGEHIPQHHLQQPQHHVTPSQSTSNSPTTASQFHHHQQQLQHGLPTGQQTYGPAQPFPPVVGTQPSPQHLQQPQQQHPQPIAPANHSINPRPGQQYHHHTAAVAQSNLGDGSRRMSGGFVGHPLAGMPSQLIVKEESYDMDPINMAGLYGMPVPAAFPQRRKAVRAAQACDACRNRKAKCDEGRPSCSFCQQNAITCVYREVPIPKQDRTMLAIQSSIDRQEKINVDSFAGVTKMLEDVLARLPLSPTHPPAHRDSMSKSSPKQATTPTQTSRPLPKSGLQNETQASLEPVAKPATSREPVHEWTMPRQHTTAAHKLLQWPSIKALVREVFSPDYVMEKETNRGSLNIYGWGEVGDQDEMTEDDSGETWGISGGIAYSGVYDQPPVAFPGGGLGYGAKQGLQLDADHVDGLLKNYLDKIHVLHPILDRRLLTSSISSFVNDHGPPQMSEEEVDTEDDGETYANYLDNSISPHHSFGPATSFSQPSTIGEHATFPSQNYRSQSFSNAPTPASRGSKRKRSSSSQQSSRPNPETRRLNQANSHIYSTLPPAGPRKQIPRTLRSCTILLVLALGAITGHRIPVPGPFQRSLAPAQPSYNAPYEPAYGGNLGPQPAPGIQALKNIDGIPGLAYFARAMEILVHNSGRTSLEYVQAGLLAGLYYGQIGRVMDSWHWISTACMACQVMAREMPDPVADEDPENHNLLRDYMLRAFWSCLQLESDVLAELDLPLSHITHLEEKMSYPIGLFSGQDYDPENELTFMYYTYQCSLRKNLNVVHYDLYRTSGSRTPGDALTTAKGHSDVLQSWRDNLPPQLRWNDSDPPATDINAARLRAKYYGAKYIIHRPFLQVYMHTFASTSNPTGASSSPALSTSDISQSSPSSVASLPAGSGGRRNSLVNDDLQIGPNQANLEAACKTCLDAAVQSTSAFHGFPADTNRPILTNIFGTAHAQFGNLLVLQAAYHHSRLRHLVDKDVLCSLVEKTIHFLKTLSPISPALAQDAAILQDAARKLDFTTNLGFNEHTRRQ